MCGTGCRPGSGTNGARTVEPCRRLPRRFGKTDRAGNREQSRVRPGSGDGAPLRLILDTGAERTVLTCRRRARRRKSAGNPVPARPQRRWRWGSLPSREIELTGFTVGGVDIPWRRLRVASFTLPLASVDGLLGTDVLGKFDVDLDLPNRRMALYEKGKCTPDWAASNAEIKIGRSAHNDHVFLPVRLDGRNITATIDTGRNGPRCPPRQPARWGLTDAALAQDQAGAHPGVGSLPARLAPARFDELDGGPCHARPTRKSLLPICACAAST